MIKSKGKVSAMTIPGEKRHRTINRDPDVHYTTPEQYRRYKAEAVQERIARAVEKLTSEAPR